MSVRPAVSLVDLDLADPDEVGVRHGRAAGESEPQLPVSVTAIGRQPGGPVGEPPHSGTGGLTLAILDITSAAVSAAIDGPRAVTEPVSAPVAVPADRRTAAPGAPLPPAAVHGQRRPAGTGRVRVAHDLLRLLADAGPAAVGRRRVAAGAAPGLGRHAAGVGAGGPGAPAGPATVPGAVGDLSREAAAGGAAVSRGRPGAAPSPTLTLVRGARAV